MVVSVCGFAFCLKWKFRVFVGLLWIGRPSGANHLSVKVRVCVLVCKCVFPEEDSTYLYSSNVEYGNHLWVCVHTRVCDTTDFRAFWSFLVICQCVRPNRPYETAWECPGRNKTWKVLSGDYFCTVSYISFSKQYILTQ